MAAGWIEDRWLTKKVDPATGKRRRTARYGKGKRYRVAGIPGVKDHSFDTLDAAKKWLAKAQHEAGGGDFFDPRDGNMPLKEYVETVWWPSLRVPPSTKEAMRSRVFNHIVPLLGALPLRAIGPDQIKAWVVEAERSLDAGTVRTTWRHLSSILQSAFEAKRIPSNPCRGNSTARPPAKPKQKARRLSRDQVAAARTALPERYRILMDLGVAAGLRQGEAFGISPDDLGGDRLQVVRQVLRINSRLAFGPPKGNKEREVPVPTALAETIAAYAEAFPPVKVTLPWVDPLRPNLAWGDRPEVTVQLLVTTPWGGGRALNRTHWDEAVWKMALVEAGIIPGPVIEERQSATGRPRKVRVWQPAREFGFHITRHTYASEVLHAGESVVTLAAWLGHADPAFTLRTYTHFMPEAGDRGMAALDAWLRSSPDDAE